MVNDIKEQNKFSFINMKTGDIRFSNILKRIL